MLRDGWRGIVDYSGSSVNDGFMLRVFCSRLSMRAEQSNIVRERTSVSVWLMQPTDVNSVYGFHWDMLRLFESCVSSHALPQLAFRVEVVANGATVYSD